MTNEQEMRGRVRPTVEYVRECFDYDVETGSLTWKVRPLHHFRTARCMKQTNSNFAGRAVTCEDDGYLKVRINGANYFVHQIALVITDGIWAAMVDHVDGNGFNNKRTNLRVCDGCQNQWNRLEPSKTKSGFKGVYRSGKNGSWHVVIRCRYKTHYVGKFDDPGDAYEFRCLAADMLHGEFANHHRPTRVRGLQ